MLASHSRLVSVHFFSESHLHFFMLLSILRFYSKSRTAGSVKAFTWNSNQDLTWTGLIRDDCCAGAKSFIGAQEGPWPGAKRQHLVQFPTWECKSSVITGSSLKTVGSKHSVAINGPAIKLCSSTLQQISKFGQRLECRIEICGNLEIWKN
jgi:hypothetical protein